ncbi:MAG: ATP-binding protein [Alphaproteobacteria bacterium]|nr:ATP-binding protein [Alphaproteobacteria bacterium]
MSRKTPTLHMLCGKIAAGKSTLAAKLGRAEGTVTLSEDMWLSQLFADQISSPADYVRCSAKLRDAMGPHVVALLNAGVSVVLDFPANTFENRSWMRSLLDQTQADHALHVLNPPDAVCLERLHKRNAAQDHPFAATEKQFEMFSKHFVLPSAKEAFKIVEHSAV